MFLVLVLFFCTLIGALCGSAVLGLVGGFVLLFLIGWANIEPAPRRRRRR